MRLLIILFFISVSCCAQDSLSIKYELLNKRVDRIELNLTRCHKQYNTGITMTLIGAIPLTMFAIATNDPVGADDARKGVWICSLITLSGLVITIDSHKFIIR